MNLVTSLVAKATPITVAVTVGSLTVLSIGAARFVHFGSMVQYSIPDPRMFATWSTNNSVMWCQWHHCYHVRYSENTPWVWESTNNPRPRLLTVEQIIPSNTNIKWPRVWVFSDVVNFKEETELKKHLLQQFQGWQMHISQGIRP